MMFGPVSVLGDFEPKKTLIARTAGVVSHIELDQGSERFQWLRDGQPIQGETFRTYVVKGDDVEHSLSVAYLFTTNGEAQQVMSKPEKVDLGFWRNLYWKELGREPDPTGLAFWEKTVKELFRQGI
jgi:hypothetical protein